ncbi:ImmA/IrrE family metallo-endopeptidase [Desulfolucanica intricata]|uniref:ImmA/IrrE family metallo-endopeptidase n=1 Tax=Desulfolucanica intricata TaxID=1285191 RepID=UPI00082952EA|nr:ImmA/IrrE family metallo-endopeptidase [Desulfolucanica intricata]
MHWISREVKELAAKYRTTNPFELADCLDYLLIEFPFKKIRGMLLVTDDITCIGYNNTLPRHLQYLVVYHEIAHRILHPEINYFMLLENTHFNLGKFEYQADKFVAELVLSERVPRSGETIYEFAARYEVPVKLVEIFVNNNKILKSTF